MPIKMAANKLLRGKKLVALCGIHASDIEKNAINKNQNPTTNNTENDIFDLNMFFSEENSLDFFSSPIRPVRVYENSTPHSASNDMLNMDSNDVLLTDISYGSVQNVTNEHVFEESVMVSNHESITEGNNLTVPSVWLENNSLTTPQLTSMLLDDNAKVVNITAIEENSQTTLKDTLVVPMNEIEEVPSSEKNTPENATDIGNCTLILNHETGVFDAVNTSTRQTNSEINSISKTISKNQQLRLLGMEYRGTKRKRDLSTSTVHKVHVVKENRMLREKKCPHGAEKKSDRSFLCSAVTDEIRSDIFQYFWQLPSWEAKKSYVNGLVQLRDTIKRRPNTTNISTDAKKKYGFDCFLHGQNGTKIRVCRSFFLATLDLKKDVLQEWVRTNSIIEPPCKVRKIDRPSMSKPKVLKSSSVDLWLEQVPVVPSHYCRANSDRTYVEDTFHSKTHMHKVYKAWCKKNNLYAVTRKMFIDKLESHKISIFKPRKDQCDTCVGYKEGNVSEEIYNLHIIKKDEAREAKKMAITEISSTVIVVTMDMQSVLLCPKLLVSEQYYKQKLAIHNFTFYVKNNKNVYLYVWHEGEGGVTANDITSCIIHFIKENCASYQKVCLISDGCSYQNRNKILSSALANTSTLLEIEIEQLILEKGHTMMEVDSVHSTLERQFKPPIYSPTDYLACMRQARPNQPYEINYLDHTFFKNYEKLQGNFSSIRPGKRAGDPTVTDIRGLRYTPDGVVKYKLRHTDPFTLLPQRRSKTQQEQVDEPSSLYDCRPKIDASKYSLQSLKKYMHKDYHYFYDNLNV